MQKLETKQKLSNSLAFQQINYIKLLQVSAMDMPDRITKEIEDNPTLEEEFTDINQIEEKTPTYITNYSRDRSNKLNEYKEIFLNNLTEYEDFRKSLLKQLSFYNTKKDHKLIAKYIIENLDNDGYFRYSVDDIIDEFAFNQYIKISPIDVKTAIELIQTFEPSGIAARNLQECLLIQMNKLEVNKDLHDDQNFQLAKLIVQNQFTELANKKFDKIIQKLKITPNNNLKQAIEIIKNLNPKPVKESYKQENTRYIFPDFLVSKNNGELVVTLTKGNTPKLKINNKYADLFNTSKKDILHAKNKRGDKNNLPVDTTTNEFLKKKINSAKWFIEAIQQRRKTLLNTMNAIVKYQIKFFKDEQNNNLKPLILKNIASITKLDVSTISRIVSNKYVQTNSGIYPLRFFFSESIGRNDGQDVSSKEVQKIISDIINDENKSLPFTDEEITALLNKRGYKIARRTVAKYRQLSKIPVRRLRKELC